MNKQELHVKQDEWSYTCTKSAARVKAKRARSKAKRALSKKLLAQTAYGEESSRPFFRFEPVFQAG